jgi:uncharacterized phage protein (TIGR01671 family)
MKEIKFRAWDSDSGMYIAPHIIHLDGRIVAQTATRNGECEIELFTGIHDRNGREIFEGDIIKHPGFLPEVVKWAQGSARFIVERASSVTNSRMTDGLMASREVEIIGNIHENPELLEGR